MTNALRRWLFDPTIGRLVVVIAGIAIIVVLVRGLSRSAGRHIANTDARYRVRKLITWLIIAKTNTGLASMSLGLSAERTNALSDTAVAAVNLVRWSWRLKVDQRVADRFSLSHSTVYGPKFNAPDSYTVTSTTIAGYDVNKAVALTLTLADNYDSQARARGALKNNDGSLLFGIRAKF